MPLDAALTATIIVAHTNALRASAGEAPVRTDPALTQTAKAYAALLAKTGAFAHDADGHTPAHRATSAGYRHCGVAENIARHRRRDSDTPLDLASAVVDGWSHSPAHRRNLLATGMSDVGVAVVTVPGEPDTVVTVQVLGRSAAFERTVRIRNASDGNAQYQLGDQAHDLRPGLTMTHRSCSDAALTIAASSGPGPSFRSTFDARDGATYTLKRRADGSIGVDITGP